MPAPGGLRVYGPANTTAQVLREVARDIGAYRPHLFVLELLER